MSLMVFEERRIVLPLLKLSDKSYLRQYDHAEILTPLPLSIEEAARRNAHFSMSRLGEQWLLRERELYIEQHLTFIAQEIFAGRYSLADILLIATQLHRNEVHELEQVLQGFLDNLKPEELADFFEKMVESLEQVRSFITQIRFLPHKVQLQLIIKGLTPHVFKDKECSTEQFILWSRLFFQLLNNSDYNSIQLDLLTKKFKFLVDKHADFLKISQEESGRYESFATEHEVLSSLWEYALQSQHQRLIQPQALKKIADFIDEINKNHLLMMRHPEKREFIHQCLKIAGENSIDYWETSTYQIIDSAPLFEEVYGKLEPACQEYLWSVCEKDFQYWVQSISDLCALLRCGTAQQQKMLLKAFSHAYNWVRGPEDLGMLLSVLVDKNQARHFLQTWPLHLWMHQSYDYVEILEHARAVGVAPAVLARYRPEFYSMGVGPDTLNIRQWERLAPESCDLIKIIQTFPEQGLGLMLAEILLYQEALSKPSSTMLSEELVAQSNLLTAAFESSHSDKLSSLLQEISSDHWRPLLSAIWPNQEVAVKEDDLMEQSLSERPLLFSVLSASSSQALIIRPEI